MPTADPLYQRRLLARHDAPEGCHDRNPTLDRELLGAFTVRSIERLAAEPVFDLTVAGDHSFVAAGVVVHNSNYEQARQAFGDMTIRPLWRNLCGSLEQIVNVPAGAELWYDDRDIPFLRQDTKKAAEIAQMEAATISQLIVAGYKPDSVVDAVRSQDWSRLVHTGLYSVQLQPPQTTIPQLAPEPATAPAPNGKPKPAVPAGGVP